MINPGVISMTNARLHFSDLTEMQTKEINSDNSIVLELISNLSIDPSFDLIGLVETHTVALHSMYVGHHHPPP